MKVPKKLEGEGLLDYATRLSEVYASHFDLRARKPKGQFFTPRQIAAYMASLSNIRDDAIRLLDPGAGTGVLSAAFCERLLENDRTTDLTIDAYESDSDLLPFLRETLRSCKMSLKRKGHRVRCNVRGDDFILVNQGRLWKTDLFRSDEADTSYDAVVCNPPYYKLNKNSPEAIAMQELVCGQPNIYSLFMALSASMLRPGGEMIFITPRSFCSGLYYQRFLEWFLKKIRISHIHVFESRKEIFDKDGVLQENIIIKAERPDGADRTRTLSVSWSKNRLFQHVKTLKAKAADAVCRKNGRVFVRIPTSRLDTDILHVVDSWPNTLESLGLGISTGPVVAFRARQYLQPSMNASRESVPLLWMNNIRGMRIVWPLPETGKPIAIRVCDRTRPLLLQVKNYVLLKRFSSKEQKRRLYAAVSTKSDFPYRLVGIENHLNYIHRPNGNLSIDEAFGVAGLLNTALIDRYFRSLNGNTQVNANDIRSVPFPDLRDVERIGRNIRRLQESRSSLSPDEIVSDVLEIDGDISRRLNKAEMLR